jgi:hypothetical protein
MRKPPYLASVLFIAAAIGLWACQHAVQIERLAGMPEQAIASAGP